MTITVDHTPLSTPAQPARTTRLHLDVPARTRLVERIAMRIALALLLWSTRPRTSDATRRARALAEEYRIRREAHWQRLAIHPHH